MVQQALNRHSQIVIPPETAYFNLFLGPLGYARWTQRRFLKHLVADLEIDLPVPERRVHTPEDARALYQQMASLYPARLGREHVAYLGDKTPQHLLVLPQVLKVFPQAKILVIYRDGRDVALSLSKFPRAPADPYAGFALWLRYVRRQQWALKQSSLDLL